MRHKGIVEVRIVPSAKFKARYMNNNKNSTCVLQTSDEMLPSVL